MATIHPESYLVILDTFTKWNGRRNDLWCRCLCTACGNEKEMYKGSLFGISKHGKNKSCGCMKKKLISEFQSKITPPGSVDHPLYPTWINIRSRCINPNTKRYKDYGGRGVIIHSEWVDNFPAFAEYVDTNLGPRPDGHSLDRINNDLGYQPGNLRWASSNTQLNNTRRNIYITHNNRTQTLAQWAEELGINYRTLQSRHRVGLTGDGLFRPVT